MKTASFIWLTVLALSCFAHSDDAARGRHLVQLMCAPCHYDPDTKSLSGREMDDLPRWMGTVYSSNITRDEKTGMAHYDDDALARLFFKGRDIDGRYIPFMVFTDLSKEDLASIQAFLRGNDPLVRPVLKQTPKSDYRLLPSLGFALARLSPATKRKQPAPHPETALAEGRYLSHLLGCFDCHSRSLSGVRKHRPKASRGYFAGGTSLRDRSGARVRTPNLTPDRTTGIGAWTPASFHQALTLGLAPSGPITHPMPILNGLSREESASIFHYLQSLPPKSRPRLHKQRQQRMAGQNSKIPRTAKDDSDPIPPSTVLDPAVTFTQSGCAACHGLDGAGPIADLRQAASGLTAEEMAAFIRNPASAGNFQMPPYGSILSQSELDACIAYVLQLKP